MAEHPASMPEPTGLIGGGQAGDLIRGKDWSTTPLGAIVSWPAELKANVQTLLSSPVPMAVLWGSEGILIYNDGYAEVCGPRHPEALGGSVLEVWPEARDFNANVVSAGLRGESLSFHAQELELWRFGQAERVWMDLEYLPIRDHQGRPIGSLAIVMDITKRVLAERRLERSREQYRFLDELGQAVANLHDADDVLRVTTCMVGAHLHLSNCAYADMDEDGDGFTIRGDWYAAGSPSIVGHYSLADFGRLAVERLGAGEPLIINDNLAELAPEEARTFRDIGIAATICMPLIKNGRLRALMAIHHREPHVWTEDELSLIRQVTERSWAHVERVGAEANLRANEEQLRLAIDAAEIGLWDVDEITGTRFWQPRVKAMFGISPDRPITPQDFAAGLHPEDRDRVADALAAAADPDRRALYDVEFRAIGKEDGVVRWVAAKGRGMFRNGRCRRVIGTAIDITERKQTEQALRDLNATLERRVAEGLAERKLLADVVENTTAIIFVADCDYRWLAINKAAADAFEAIYGVRPAVGDSMLELLDHVPEERDHLRETWGRAFAGEEFSLVETLGDPARQRRCFQLNFNVLRDPSGRQIGACQISHDVTERTAEQRRLAEAEEQLRQAQKVEALGQLTGGVAHDFNNLLTPIIGSLDLLVRRGIGNDRERQLIGGALQSAERARTLVQRLLAFARRQPLQPTAIDVRALVTGMGELVASTTGPQVQVVIEAADDLPPARADHNQVEMALLNLAVNARDAMSEGGTLRISAAPRVVEETEEGGELKPGRYVMVSVADTGVGMDAETAARAIEPFFSTKGIGKGTGLGLSMVHGLARQLGGGIRIFSRPGFGTNVELWLPAASEAASPHPPGGEEPAPRSGRRGKALLVDDEDAVRTATAHMLEEAGFTVIEAASGQAALVALGEQPDMAVLVTDHLMPGMDGTQLARRAKLIRSDLPCLIISGYADVEGIAPDLPRLAKPFRARELIDALNMILPADPDSGSAHSEPSAAPRADNAPAAGGSRAAADTRLP
ncbi:PAS domain S-box protein [Sphingomonas sp. IC4-52]|uniref:PAS domain S-box protein n=1 Tax=Sphingomonas sp. IC4-52 TaxID=2887202 RepID=UPI001D1301FF|nr:PAS domain S-box protein [Sphingomonas sp. IC4-52]MCC2981118.1 PAS domain S-box protein [Sphingomonas sp. IC4-52]